MPHSPLSDVVQYLRRTCAIQEARDQPDGELLRRFLAHRDEAAFAALVHRHGPLVMGVCRRILRDSHSAEDGFQATFMVLVRKMASIGKDPLGGWLHAVARRVALKERAKMSARRRREKRLQTMPQVEALDETTWQELRPILDEEIGRLPAKYRMPIVLCYLQGKTHDRAAKELGCPRTSLTNRLAHGRELLRRQLVKRGIALSAAALATALSEQTAGATVAALLTIKTVKAALSVTAAKAVAAGCISAEAVSLAEHAMTGLFGLKGKMVVLVLALGLTAGGAGLAAYGGFGESDEPGHVVRKSPPLFVVNEVVKQQKEKVPRTDLYGDPLPAGAVARFGSIRWRHGAAINGSALSADGKRLATSSGHSVAVWDVADGKRLWQFTTEYGSNWNRPSLSISPDGKRWGMFTTLTLPSCGIWKQARRFGLRQGTLQQHPLLSVHRGRQGFCSRRPRSAMVLGSGREQSKAVGTSEVRKAALL